MKFENGGNVFNVIYDMQMVVKFLFVIVYRLIYEVSEIWCGKEFFGLIVVVDCNGDFVILNVECKGNEI